MSVNPQDLRIGNYVYDDEGTTVKIESLRSKEFNDWNGGDDHQILFSKNGDLCWSSPVFGIPLTPQLLEQCGFTNQIEEEIPEGAEFLCFFKDNIDIELRPGLLTGYEVEGITLYEDHVEEDGQLVSVGKYELKSDIRCLHQLQNLYYALTDTELSINLT